MGFFYDRAAMTVSGTPGTGVITLASAYYKHQTFASAGVTDGATVTYAIEDGASWEVGKGTYASSGPTLTRTTIYFSSNANTAINASSSAVVFGTITQEDMFGNFTGASWDYTNKSLTLGGATVTTSKPVLDLTQTWNAGAVTFTGFRLNITNTASASTSRLFDYQIGGTSNLYATIGGSGIFQYFRAGGSTFYIASYNVGSPSISFNAKYGVNENQHFVSYNAGSYGWTSSGTCEALLPDTLLTRAAAASIQQGAADAAAPVAQTTQVQSVVAGTSNVAGANWTLSCSRGTGTGAGGDLIVQVAPAGSTGSSQNALTQAFRVNSNKTVIAGAAFTVATLPVAGTQGRRAWVTDATAPTFLGALTGGGAVVCPVFDNGTAWVAG